MNRTLFLLRLSSLHDYIGWWLYPLHPVHVRSERLRYENRAIGLLVVLQRGIRIRGEATAVLFRVWQ